MIRAYKKEDLPVIMDIGNRAWKGIYAMFRGVYGEELFNLMKPQGGATKGQEIKEHCEATPGQVFVCEEAGKIVGFVTFFLDDKAKVGEISNNAVDPECGVKGVGQQMYKAVFEEFKKKGMVYAKVITGLDDAHERARKAYERAGFDRSTSAITYYKKL
ncbi:MAG: hypothetical protein A2297_06270 [Elusimicrobia bacterium RIFOXYB2_FULL_48_7]|nr:MAG: hypothetical protein A2297_06270 [Elusimicrobia bacterium RIFOXYB2_FULL_48_7]